MEIIRRAEESESAQVVRFYETLIDDMQYLPYFPAWKKGVYPSREYLDGAVRRGEMFLGMLDGEIAGAMILNRRMDGEYDRAIWPSGAGKDEIMLIHTLAVRPDCIGRGYGRQLVAFALDKIRAQGMKAVRLDVLRGNLPAERLYRGMGFQHAGTIRMYYEDTGWAEFELFEYVFRGINHGSE